MAQVDPHDDDIRRFVVHHFRYDEERHERRNVVVAAFDDETEFTSFVQQQWTRLRELQQAGEADPRELITGSVLEAGHDAAARRARQRSRAALRRPLPPGTDGLGARVFDPRSE